MSMDWKSSTYAPLAAFAARFRFPVIAAATVAAIVMAAGAARAEKPLLEIDPSLAGGKSNDIDVGEKASRDRDLRVQKNQPAQDKYEEALDKIGRAAGPSDYEHRRMTQFLDRDGLPKRGEINYYVKDFDEPIFEIQVDKDGQIVSRDVTPAGRVYANMKFLNPNKYPCRYGYSRDNDGNSYIDSIECKDETGRVRVSYKFNEEGVPYEGGTNDEDGKLVSILRKPELAPKPIIYGKKLPVPESLGTVTGIPENCRLAAEKRNELAASANLVRAEVIKASEQNVGTQGTWNKILLAKYDDAMKRWKALKDKHDVAHQALLLCLDKRPDGGKKSDQPKPKPSGVPGLDDEDSKVAKAPLADRRRAGNLPSKIGMASWPSTGNVMQMRIAPKWSMHDGRIEVDFGARTLVSTTGDPAKAQEHIRDWGFEWVQSVKITFDNGSVVSGDTHGEWHFEPAIPAGARRVKEITLFYGTDSQSALPVTWDNVEN